MRNAMWLIHMEGTSHLLLLCISTILVVLALILFGSLPCSCKIIYLLRKNLCKKHGARVADSSGSACRNFVIGGICPGESPPPQQYPAYPFATSTSRPSGCNSPRGVPCSNSRSSRSRGITIVTLTSSTTLGNSNAAIPSTASPDAWAFSEIPESHLTVTELPPSYDSLYPIHFDQQNSPETQQRSGGQSGTEVTTFDTTNLDMTTKII